MGRFLLCSQIVCDLFASDKPMGWDMTLHHILVVFTTVVTVDHDAAEKAFGKLSIVEFQRMEALSLLYAIAAGGFVKPYFNLRYRLCYGKTHDKLHGQVQWISRAAYWHVGHTIIFFGIVPGYFTIKFVLDGLGGTFMNILMISAWLVMCILEGVVGNSYFSIVSYKSKLLKAEINKVAGSEIA